MCQLTPPSCVKKGVSKKNVLFLKKTATLFFMKRKKIPYKKSKKLFTKTARRVNSANGYVPMRGGIRF